jgi:hypothetical protein
MIANRTRKPSADNAAALARRVRRLERRIQTMRFTFGFALGAVSGVAVMAILAERRRARVKQRQG